MKPLVNQRSGYKTLGWLREYNAIHSLAENALKCAVENSLRGTSESRHEKDQPQCLGYWLNVALGGSGPSMDFVGHTPRSCEVELLLLPFSLALMTSPVQGKFPHHHQHLKGNSPTSSSCRSTAAIDGAVGSEGLIHESCIMIYLTISLSYTLIFCCSLAGPATCQD